MDKLIVGSEAIAAGVLTRHELRQHYDAVFRDVYLPAGVELTAALRAKAAYLWAGREAVVCGVSAAALLGNRYISADRVVELNRHRRNAPKGIVIRGDRLMSDECTIVGQVAVTTPARTIFDIGRRVQTNRAVELADVLLRDCDATEVDALIARHRGARGLRRLQNVLFLADPGAESVQETRLRLCLVGGGLPRPETQIELRAPGGRAVRLDMGWRAERVAAEFDGAQHWGDSAQHRRDIERQEFIASIGWKLIRVSRDQLANDPGAVVARVRSAYRARAQAA